MSKKEWLKQFGKLGLQAAKVVYPSIVAVEAGIEAFKSGASSDEKLNAAEQIALASLDIAEDVTEKDLLNDVKVREAYRGLISAYVTFMNALAAAKEAKVS